MAKSKGEKDKLPLVSFKLAKELYKQLEEYSKTQTDEAGIQLSPSQAARRLMLEALKRSQQKKP